MIISAFAQVAKSSERDSLLLRNREGKTFSVPTRKALPIEAQRVRYPGFKQETLILKKRQHPTGGR